MEKENIFTKIKQNLPESFWRFLIIGFIIYSFVVVGKVIYDNYQQNKMIEQQRQEIVQLREEVTRIRLNIAYYKTDTFKEKVARGKLRYSLPGENAVAVPYDEIKEKKITEDASPLILNRPNYIYWKIYFFGE
jgi:cell division protein FtsB